MGIGKSDPTTRRTFLTALSAASYTRIAGANDRVQVGFIGYGLIGSEHVRDFKNQHDTDLAALSDVYQPRLEQGVAACGGRAKAYSDFRKLLDDKDIQAVVVSTPDHWHALMTIMACAAGKDVYVEKPLNLFIREGQWMIEAARRYQRVVQVGTQQRSGKHYQKAVEMLRAGYIGKVTSVRMGSFRNIMPGFGAPTDSAPPNDLDYDMWLGPAPNGLQPAPLPLSFPLVLGLLRRPNDQSGRARDRRRPVGHAGEGADRCFIEWRPLCARGRWRDTRHAGRALRISGIHSLVLAARGGRRASRRRPAGLFRHERFTGHRSRGF